MRIRAQHAYNAVFGLPEVAARPVQERAWQVITEHSNQFMGGDSGSEGLVLDGETTGLSIHYHRSLMPCWQGEIVLPFIQHSSGSFDRAIDDWHQFFGLPDAQRREAGFDVLNYTYADASGSAVTVDSAQSGIGDVRLSVQNVMGCQGAADTRSDGAIARIGIKLPTGSVSELRGSGRVDYYADIQSPVWRTGSRWRAGASAGLLLPGRTDALPSQRSLVVYGTLGAQLLLTQRFSLMLQLDWHTAYYHSALRELGDPVAVLSTGLRYVARKDQALELTISEDVAIDTAPDIVARLAWTYRPNRLR